MGFWETFWATMWGALGGAVVAAFAAWLFSLDLRRREREDRKQERDQDRLDREAERAQAHDDRQSELYAEREIRRMEREQDQHAREAERQEEREHRYKTAMRRQWLELEHQITLYDWASGVEQTSRYPMLSKALMLTGAMARGDDRKVFDTIKELFDADDYSSDRASGISTIIAVYARDGLPLSFTIDQLHEVAKEPRRQQDAEDAE